MTKELNKAVQANVVYRGCRADYAYDHPEYQAPRFYNKSPEGSEIRISTTDTRLPDRNKTHFYPYNASPTHMVQSIDWDFSEDRKNLSLQESVTRCYSKAKLHGYKYFGLQDNGICVAGNETIGDQLPLDQCNRKKGGPFTTSIYEIRDLEYADTWSDVKDEAEFVKQYRYTVPVISDKMLPPIQRDAWFELTPSQQFTQKYFTPQNPSKGLNLLKGPGTGKTCDMLNMAGNFMSGARGMDTSDNWRVMWITRKSLQGIPDRDLFGSICLTKLREMVDSGDPLTTSSGEIRAGRLTDDQIRERTGVAEITPELRETANRDDKIAAIRSQDANIRVLLANQFGIELKKSNIMSYDHFIKVLMRATKADAEAYDSQVRHSDFGFKTLFIMDEAHNWTSKELPALEREYLDKEFPGGFEISGKHFYDKSDVYGKSIASGQLKGRDMWTAFLQRSYELSGDKSAKSILATATVDNLFWMLNTMLPKERDRVSMSPLDYYDQFNLKLKPEMMEKLARAAYGKISHLDVSEIPDQFAQKLLEAVHTSHMHDFHRDILKKQLADHPKESDEVYRNIMVFAQVTGSVYSHAQIQQYESNWQVSQNWNNVQSREEQINYYNAHFLEVRNSFGLEPNQKDVAQYNQKLAAFTKYREALDKYAEKHRLHLLKSQFKNDATKPVGPPIKVPVMPDQLKSAIKDNKLVSFQYWEDPEFSHGVVIPESVRRAWEQLFQEYRNSRNPQSPIIGPDGYPMSQLQYWRQVNPAASAQRAKYHKLEQLFHVYQEQMLAYRRDHENREKWALVSRSKSDPGKQPEMPKTLKGFSLDGVNPLSIDEYTIRTKSVPLDKQKQFFQFLIRDPGTQKQRMKTLEEFVSVQPVKPVWDSVPEDSQFSFLAWSKRFNPVRSRELLEYYAPMVHQVIQNIISIEKDALARLGHGFKHMVFTFSSASPLFPNHGSRAVLSAFAAYPEVFQIMVQHSEFVNDKGKKQTSISNPPTEKWGVTCLSSGTIPAESIPGNEDSHPQILDFAVGRTVSTATTAWSAPDNPFGARIKVIVLDDNFAEGVDITETEIAHFLGAPKSSRKLMQAMSRVTRQRKSQNLDFFAGIGAFVRYHFYELRDPVENNSVYDQMIANMSYTEKLENDLTDTINAMIPEMSVDYALTKNLREFHPVHSGEIVDIDPRVGYIVRMNVVLRGEQTETHLLVDPGSVIHKWKRGDPCVVQNEVGYVEKISGEKVVVSLQDLKQTLDLSELRIPVGNKIAFHIPNGVDFAKKVLNIGDYNNIHTSVIVDHKLETLKVEKVSLGDATEATFLSDPKYFLLGIFGLVTLLNESRVSLPLHIVLPGADQKYYLEPNITTYGMRWGCSDLVRELQYHPEVLASFLSPQTGISIMVLSLQNLFCSNDPEQVRELVNWLIYCPEQKTIERFDPRGRVLHSYDVVSLDARLFDLFQELRPDCKYMCVSQESGFLQESTGLTHASAVALIYMHARILYFASDHKSEMTPIEFQESLFDTLNKVSSKKLGRYAAGYTKKLMAIQKKIVKSSDYRDDMPFWTNAVMQIYAVIEKMRGTRKTKLDNMDDLAASVFGAFD